MGQWIKRRIGTLKGRLAIMLFLATLVPIVLVGYVSYYWVYMIQIDRNNEDMRNRTQAMYQDLENRLDELGRASQLLVVEGGIGRELIQYLESGSQLDRTLLYQNLLQSTANVGFANPGFTLMFYYVSELSDPVLFPSVPISTLPDDFEQFQPLFTKKLLSYRGPHRSLSKGSNATVVSLLRKLEYTGSLPLYIYIERDVSDILNDQSKRWVMVNEAGKVAYSGLENVEVGSSFQLEIAGYQRFGAEGSQAWTLQQLIPDQEFFHIINRWKWQFIIIALISLLVGVLMAFSIWRMIYSPIHTINRAINRYSYDVTVPPSRQTGLQEFDLVLDSFQQMKSRIAALIVDVEEKEKWRGQLEVEKLLVQINPHFLHNTLNTIQWIARINGQQDIARLVSIFTRILHYNLGKKSIIVTVREEVAAIKDYIDLQSIRYDHQFHIELDIDPDTLDVSIPRFILQPLVENAMYHGGQDDNMTIAVRIRKHEVGIKLSVEDNGDGIPEDKLNQLLEESDDLRKSGLGIGLSYVRKMLDVYYDDTALFEVSSLPGQGTEIRILLPGQLKEDVMT